MKRIDLRKYLPVILVLPLAFTYINCDDNGEGPLLKNTEYCISANLSNWIPGNNTLYANINSATHHIYPIALCQIDDQGNFNLCLPPALTDTALMSADSIFYSGCTEGNTVFIPPDARGVGVYSFIVKRNNANAGFVNCSNFYSYDSIKAGDFEIVFIYVNKTVTVSGYKLCDRDTLLFSCTAETGWNRVIKHYTRVADSSITILYDKNEPPGAVWKYYPDN